MTSMIAKPVILKRDRLGRVRTPLAQREDLLDAFERSGLSGMKFAALHGVKYPSFAHWVRQRKRRQLPADAGSGSGSISGSAKGKRTGSSQAAVQWWEAVVDGAAALTDGVGAAGSALRLHLPGGVWMEITAGSQVGWAVPLLRALAPQARCCGQKLQPLRS